MLMRGRWEVTDEKWAAVEPVLRPPLRATEVGLGTRGVPCWTAYSGFWAPRRSGVSGPRNIRRSRPATADSNSRRRVLQQNIVNEA